MADHINILKEVVLFQDLEPENLELLGKCAVKRSYPLGSYLFHAGTARTEISIIVKGELEILRGIGEAQNVVARLGPGNFVGEGTILSDEPHSTSCRAVIDTEVLTLKRSSVEELIKEKPELAGKIFSRVA